MTAHDRAVRAVVDWFDEPSPADPARLAGMIGLIYSPELATDRTRLDELAIGSVVRDEAGLVLEVVNQDDEGNVWYQTGDEEPIATEAITLPAAILHEVA